MEHELFYWTGFKNGFHGTGAIAVSDCHDRQTAYFNGYSDGRKQSLQIREVIAFKGDIDEHSANRLMKDVWDQFYAKMKSDHHLDWNWEN